MRFGPMWKLIDFEGAIKTKTVLPREKCLVTPIYMPPEVAAAINIDAANIVTSRIMDVWSVGLCAMEAVFLQPVLQPWYDEWLEPDGCQDKFLEWLGNYE